MTTHKITLWNTGLPLLIVGASAWFLPRFIAPADTPSHKQVTIAIAASDIVLILVSTGLFAALQPDKFARTAELGGVLIAIEIAVRGSLQFVVVWLPIMLLCWLNLAQRVEHWRGKDMVQRGS